ncbi:MAG TPA: hypothetical protein VNL92_02815, partial [Dehalococcoidia bacterium]|nr:hypothetical protein [Dehalococcoidia bacterium]
MIQRTKRTRRAAVGALALLGAARLYRAAFYHQARRRVLKVERRVPYDPDLLYPDPMGRPIYLVDPRNDTTLLFLSGYRMLSMPGEHLDWFRELHGRGINVLAPLVGIQSLPFDHRIVGTTLERDVREAVQVLDAYRSTLPSDHRIICASMSYGSIPSFAIAALRDVSDFVLLGPASVFAPTGRSAHSSATLQRMRNPTLRGWALALRPRALSQQDPMMKVVTRIVEGLAPLLVRTRVESGWDIADPERRAEAHQRFLLPADVPMSDMWMLERSMRLVRESYLPRITGKRFLMAWGELDSVVMPEQNEALADQLERLGNDVIRRPCERSGHLVLMDGERDQVM